MDASLIEDLDVVGLCTEAGSVRVKDLTAYQIRMASKLGSITSNGILDGNVVAELMGDGDFFATIMAGPSATVTTESGDINIWEECRCERSHFFTRCGNISASDLHNQNFMSIKEEGNIDANLIEGSISAVVRKGDIELTIDALSDHSTLHVTEGDITVHIPSKPGFRINATAPETDVAPSIVDTGEVFACDTEGYETFTTTGIEPAEKGSKDEASSKPKVISFHETEPTLNMITNKGKIKIAIKESEQKQDG